MKHKNRIENVTLQLQKKKQKWNYPFPRTITRVTMKTEVCVAVSSIGKNCLVAKKEERKKRKEKVER
jgi:hypothetical protein